MDTLPIDEVLPRVLAALRDRPNAVLAAPPGAGKTTRVPVALAGAEWAGAGRVVVLEPRRLAARAAAERMAAERGEAPGGHVGYRIRGETRVGPATRVEVVTEGVLTRMLQADPGLDGVAALVFDEIHERSIHSDLGLALALEVQGALRPELRLLAMSATLEVGPLSRLMDAPVIESAGRTHPIDTRWLEQPWRQPGPERPRAFESAAAALVERALAETAGDVLVFLPGAGEIGRVAARLSGVHAAVVPLHGALPFARQAAALRPDPAQRRVVLSTAIAETSLTVPGVRVVVDTGRARRAETDPATGLTRLVTRPVSRAEAEQRQGRAGREAPGVCYRMWMAASHGALPERAPPEMLTADLAPLALELAAWGAEPASLAFLDPPPAGPLAQARSLLTDLGALDRDGRITAKGQAMTARAAHPRLAHMLIEAEAEGLGAEAALLAALASERDPLSNPGGGPPPADLGLRIAAVLRPRRFQAEQALELDRGRAERVLREARRLAPGGRVPDPERARAEAGALLARAWPDRIALRRGDRADEAAGVTGTRPGRFLLSGGRGAVLAPGDPLSGERLLVALELADRRPVAVIRRAAPISEAALRAALNARIEWSEEAAWDRRQRQVAARRRERLGAIVLDQRPWRDAPAEALGAALLDGVRDLGLEAVAWPPAAERLRARIAWLRRSGRAAPATDPGAGDGEGATSLPGRTRSALAKRLPDWSDAALLATLEDWLLPYLDGLRRVEEIGSALDLGRILRDRLGSELAAAVDRAAPDRFSTPLGRQVPIDYGGDEPMLSVRVQEMFGVIRHPLVGDPPVPLKLELLSPAGRPVQATRDLPGFWRGSYAEVRKEMRARYPKHPWPEDPTVAVPTLRANRRKG